MKCNKDKCIFYNTIWPDNCEQREDLTEECIKAGHKDYRETLEG